MSKESTVSVFVKNMRVNLRIGLEDFEREAPQPVDISIELFTGPEYLSGAGAETIIDYALIYEAIKSWESRDHVELIETYLEELVTLGFSFARVTALRASISKPEIFEEVQGAGLEVFMRRGDCKG